MCFASVVQVVVLVVVWVIKGWGYDPDIIPQWSSYPYHHTHMIKPSYPYEPPPKPSYTYDQTVIPLWSNHHLINMCFTCISAHIWSNHHTLWSNHHTPMIEPSYPYGQTTIPLWSNHHHMIMTTIPVWSNHHHHISGCHVSILSKQLLHRSITDKRVFNYNVVHYRRRVYFSLWETRNQRQTKRFKIYRWTKQKVLGTTVLKHYYNNYEYCTLQQQLSKNNARQVNNKQLIVTNQLFVFLCISCFILFFCLFDCVLKTCHYYCIQYVRNPQ